MLVKQPMCGLDTTDNYGSDWEFAAFGRCITDENNTLGFIDVSNNIGFVDEPRVWGAVVGCEVGN